MAERARPPAAGEGGAAEEPAVKKATSPALRVDVMPSGPPIDLDEWLRRYLELVLALEAYEACGPVAGTPRLSVG